MTRFFRLTLGFTALSALCAPLSGCAFLDDFSTFHANQAADGGKADGGGSGKGDGGNDGGPADGAVGGKDGAVVDACKGVSCTKLDSECNKGVCKAGKCEAQPRNEGKACSNACETSPVCSAGVCKGSATKDCSSLDDACNKGVCKPSTGTCEAQPMADTTSCNDSDPCTDGDACVAGSCVGSLKDCSSVTEGCKMGQCNPSTGDCLAVQGSTGVACDDGNDCTTGETCQDNGWCGNTSQAAVGAPCDDFNTCTKNTQCDAKGSCKGGTPDHVNAACDDDNECTTGETCDSKGACTNGTPTNDGSPCESKCRIGTSAVCTNGTCTDPPGTSSLNPSCDFFWCGNEHLCDIGFQHDGSCDCGCNFDDSADCTSACTKAMCIGNSTWDPNSLWNTWPECDSNGQPAACPDSYKTDKYCECGCTFADGKPDPECSGGDCCTDGTGLGAGGTNRVGCSIDFVRECVCSHDTKADPFCCGRDSKSSGYWDATCAAEAVSLGCAVCP